MMQMAGYEKGRSIDRRAQRALLERVWAAARTVGDAGVVVFDLDSTLFDNRPRQARILREFGAQSGLAPLAHSTAEAWVNWDIGDAMRAAGLDEARVVSHVEAAKAFWRERFFTSPYCVDDVPIAGAVAFVAGLVERGARIAYCTGRHVAMGEGTVECFRAHGFPLPDERRVHLLLKPTFDMSDDAWKAVAYARLAGIGEVLAAFDNEPAHVNGYGARFPSATVVHLATDDSGRPIPVAPGIPSIADFVV